MSSSSACSCTFSFLKMLTHVLVCVLINVAVARLDLKYVPIEIKELHVPPLEEIAQVLQHGLEKHYKEVEVDVVDCPDLRKPPFTLASPGLNGKTRLVGLGGVQYLMPFPNHTKVYDVRDVLQTLELSSAFVFGATSSPYGSPNSYAENIFIMNIDGDKIDQHSRIMNINDDGSYSMIRLSSSDTSTVVLTDLFFSEGKSGPVLRVHVRNRFGKNAFSVTIQKVLAEHYGKKIVGLGGTFVLHQGTALHSLLALTSKTPLNTFQDVENWLRPYNMSAPLISVGVIISGKTDLEFRLHHFHSFSHHGDGGHYNTDVTPETADYLGYFNTAEYAYRIDQPTMKIIRNDD